MAEPPSPWAAPGDESQSGVPGSGPGPSERPAAPPPASPPGWGTPPAGGPTGPGWGTPPAGPPPPGWGAQPPGAPAGPGWGPPPGQHYPPPGPGYEMKPGYPGAGPGIVPLRPLVIGEIYDGAVRAIRSNPRTMVGFSAVVISLLTLLSLAPQAFFMASLANSPLSDPAGTENYEFGDFAGLISSGSLTLLAGLLSAVVGTVVVNGLLIVAVDGAVRGRALTPGQLWARCRSRVLALFGLAFTVLLALGLLLALVLAPGVALVLSGSEVAGALLLVVGMLLWLVACAVVYLGYWAVAAPSLILENLGVFAALGRSYRLVRGSFWRVLGIGLLTLVITAIVRQLFTLPFGLLSGVVLALTAGDEIGFGDSLLQLLIADVGEVLAGAVLYPFGAGVTALLYLDLRIRREGLDVDLMRS